MFFQINIAAMFLFFFLNEGEVSANGHKRIHFFRIMTRRLSSLAFAYGIFMDEFVMQRLLSHPSRRFGRITPQIGELKTLVVIFGRGSPVMRIALSPCESFGQL